jgi:phosphate/sulfate permease
MIGLVLWFGLSILVAAYAEKKGRSLLGFFLISLCLSPLIGFVIAVAISPKLEKLAKKSKLKKCPDCAEYGQKEARACRFCGYRFSGGAFKSQHRFPEMDRAVRESRADFCTQCGVPLRDDNTSDLCGDCSGCKT